MEKTAHQRMLEAKLHSIGKMIADEMPEGVGFAMVMFDFGEGGFFSYLSTAERADMVALLDEWRKRLVELEEMDKAEVH